MVKRQPPAPLLLLCSDRLIVAFEDLKTLSQGLDAVGRALQVQFTKLCLLGFSPALAVGHFCHNVPRFSVDALAGLLCHGVTFKG